MAGKEIINLLSSFSDSISSSASSFFPNSQGPSTPINVAPIGAVNTMASTEIVKIY